MSGVFIIGTDTDIGKTFVTTGLYKYLNERGVEVYPYKPVQSGAITVNDKLLSGDIHFLCEKNQLAYEEKMNTYLLKAPVSPHLASELEGITINKKKIFKAFKNLTDQYAFVLCEGAGGLNVPLVRQEYFLYDLIKEMNLEVILVSDARVGTINHTLLTINQLKDLEISVRGIVLNRYSGTYYEKDNYKILTNETNLPITIVEEDTNIEKAFRKTNFDIFFKEEMNGA